MCLFLFLLATDLRPGRLNPVFHVAKLMKIFGIGHIDLLFFCRAPHKNC